MRYVIPIGFMLLSGANIGYLLRFHIRRWLRAKVFNKNLPPHQRWPEVAHWQEGDVFEVRSAYCGQFILKSLTLDGSAFGYEGLYCGGDRLEKWAISSLVGHNRSLRERRLRSEMQTTSTEYMELLKAFNESVAELERRDEKLKLVS